MKKSHLKRRKNSGQVLVITSLIVVMLLLSAVIYVRETKMDAPIYTGSSKISISAIKQATSHTVISALANISNDGATEILSTNLNQLEYVLANCSYSSILNLNYTPLSNGIYQDGVWISWGATGEGTSSAYVDFVLETSGVSTDYYSEYAVNITSKLAVNGNYVRLTGALKQVNVTCTIYNEDKPALAQNMTVYFEYDGSLSTEQWIQVVSPTTIDYGNGTYLISFTASTNQRTNPMLVSVHTHDARGILILANATCTLN